MRCVEDDIASDPGVEERLGSSFMRPEVGFAVVDDEFLNGGVAKGDRCPAKEQRHETPGEEMGSDEQGARRDEEEEENSRGERFVGEVREWSYRFQDGIMEGAEVVHAVL